jgi:hypothetical protein
MEREVAERIFLQLDRRTLPIQCELDTYERFGDHLVVKLLANEQLSAIHRELMGYKVMEAVQRGDSFDYNPHITIAHGRKSFLRIACPEGKFLLKEITLFEKPQGGEYHPHLVTEFR